MHRIRAFLNHPCFFWAVLAVPSIPMIIGFGSGRASPESLLHPSGEFAARLMIVAMMLTPLRMLFPAASWLRWLARRRRALGVAAFAYAALHTLFYIVDMESLRAMAAESLTLGIWTGWAAMLIFVPLAITSSDGAMRRMRKWWPVVHRWVYGAAILTLIHWIFVHNNLGPALVNFIPLALLEAYRVTMYLTSNIWRFS
ncbi:MAG: ferric reductase-like transmembrane domain-containing protein [Proteobacteria bacterium]|nr:ferric reductase-like transmembrane domain-containing protein [Pseudomonadota bacterium]